MRGKKVFVFILVLLFFLNACSESTTSENQDNNEQQEEITITLVSPKDGDLIIQFPFTVQWESNYTGSDATYVVYAGQSKDDLQQLATVTQTSYEIPALAPGLTFYWKVELYVKDRKLAESPVWSFTISPFVKFSLQLLYPQNGATDVAIPVTFLWTPEGTTIQIKEGEVNYDLYLGTSPNDMSAIATNIPTPTFTYLQLTPETTYYWKVDAHLPTGKTVTSDIFSFTTAITTPVSTFTLLYPLDNSSGVPTSGRFAWTPYQLPTTISQNYSSDVTYSIFLGTDPLNLSMYASNIAVTYYQYSGLQTNTTYYWKVVAYANDQQLAETSIWKFTTENIPQIPIGFNLLYPLNNSTGVELPIHFSWSAPVTRTGESVTYSLCLGKDPANLSLISDSITDPFYVYTYGTTSTTYFWTVTATISGSGEEYPRILTAPIWKFTTITQLKVDLYSPENGATGVSTSPQLIWLRFSSPSGSTVTYYVYYGTSADNLQLAGTTDQLYYSLSNLQYSTTYYWKVEAHYDIDQVATSDIWSFTTQASDQVSLYQPADGSTVYYLSTDPSTALSWKSYNASGTVTYKLFVGTSSTSLSEQSCTPQYDSNTDTYYCTYSPLSSGTTYYWKVEAYVDGNYAATSPVWSFTAQQQTISP